MGMVCHKWQAVKLTFMINYFMMEAEGAIHDIKKRNPEISNDEIKEEVMEFMELLIKENIICELEWRIEEYLEILDIRIEKDGNGK